MREIINERQSYTRVAIMSGCRFICVFVSPFLTDDAIIEGDGC